MEPRPWNRDSLSSVEITLGDGETYELASPLSRLVARTCDFFLIFMILLLLYGGASYFWGFPGEGFRAYWVDDSSSGQDDTAEALDEHQDSRATHVINGEPCLCNSDENGDADNKDEAERTSSDSAGTAFSQYEMLLLIATLTLYELIVLAGIGRGRSPGRALAGIRVVRVRDGRALSWREAINRWSILGIGFSILMLWPSLRDDWRSLAIAAASGATILLSGTRQGWHDMAAGSVVVRQPREPSISIGRHWTVFAKKAETCFVWLIGLASVALLIVRIVIEQIRN